MNEYTPIFYGEPNQNPPSSSVYSYHDIDGHQHLKKSDGSILNTAYSTATQGRIPVMSDAKGVVMGDSPLSVSGGETFSDGNIAMATNLGVKQIRAVNTTTPTDAFSIGFTTASMYIRRADLLGAATYWLGSQLDNAVIFAGNEQLIFRINSTGFGFIVSNPSGVKDVQIDADLNFRIFDSNLAVHIDTNTLTANRTQNLQDKDGTIALLTDITGAGFATILDELADVTVDFNYLTPTSADDGKILFFDTPTGQWITDEAVTHGTSVINAKTSVLTGSIPKGLPVYINGFDNDLHVVELADANGASTYPVIGFTAEPLNDTDSKHLITFGKLTGVNTSNAVTTLNPNGETWTVGTSLYLSTTAGGLTSVRPTGGGTAIQRVAKVLKVDATGGQLFIFNTARTAGLPNISQNTLWVGDASGYPTEVSTTSVGIYAGSGTIPTNTTATVTDWVKFEGGQVYMGSPTSVNGITGRLVIAGDGVNPLIRIKSDTQQNHFVIDAVGQTRVYNPDSISDLLLVGNVIGTNGQSGMIVTTGIGSTVSTINARFKNSSNVNIMTLADNGYLYVEDRISVGGNSSIGRINAIAVDDYSTGIYVSVNSSSSTSNWGIRTFSNLTNGTNYGGEFASQAVNTGVGGNNGNNYGIQAYAFNAVGRNIGVSVGVGSTLIPSNGDYGVLTYMGNAVTSQTISYGSYLVNAQTNTATKYGERIASSGTRASGTTYGSYIIVSDNITTGTIYGQVIDVNSAVATNVYSLLVNGGNIVFNNGLGDWDFQVKGDNDPFALYVDASVDYVGMGTATPAKKLDIVSTTSGILIPRMSTVNRDAIVTPIQSELIWNFTTDQFEYYDGSSWVALGATDGNGIYGGSGTVPSATTATLTDTFTITNGNAQVQWFPNNVAITTDGGAFGEGWFEVGTQFASIGYGGNPALEIRADVVGIVPAASIGIKYNSINNAFNSNLASGRAVFINARGGVINAGVSNATIIGGTGATTYVANIPGMTYLQGGLRVAGENVILDSPSHTMILNRINSAVEALLVPQDGMIHYNTNELAYRTHRNSFWRSLTNKYTQQFTGVVGADTFVVTHNLNTTSVVVSVLNLTTNDHDQFDVDVTNANTVTITGNADTGVNYLVTIIG